MKKKKQQRAGIKTAAGVIKFLARCPHCARTHTVDMRVKNYATRATYDWTGVDWTRSNGEIARQIGCHPSLVSGQRQRRAPHTTSRRIIDWLAIDWRKSGKALANEIGCSLSHISTMRKKWSPSTSRSQKKLQPHKSQNVQTHTQEGRCKA